MSERYEAEKQLEREVDEGKKVESGVSDGVSEIVAEEDMFKSPLAAGQASLDSSELTEDGGIDFDAETLKRTAGFTPAIIKLRQSRLEFQTFSPSDQLVSPCTRKLEKCQPVGSAFSQPVLRARAPQNTMPPASCGLSTSGGGKPSLMMVPPPSPASGETPRVLHFQRDEAHNEQKSFDAIDGNDEQK